MGKIIQLDPKLQNLIAAGEVVERTMNVVKELVENAIDAGSDRIDIVLEESGLKKIQVTDNGTGMDNEDAILAFKRHATSKIRSEYDLFHIRSLGFRGEALPSIGAIARVELQTSTGDNDGLMVIVQDGELLETKASPPRKGTSVKVTRLFYHTPARFKYLKSPQAELAAIQDLVDKYALCRPDVAFRLENDGKVLFHTSGNRNMTDIFARIYGLEVAKGMKPFSGKNRDFVIDGYFAEPVHNRSSRNYLTTIVNNRPIRDHRLIAAISEAFGQLIPQNRYPIAFLSITVDPQLIDVNIHPTKLEIKFSEAGSLYGLIIRILRRQLQFMPVIQKGAIPSKDCPQSAKPAFPEQSAQPASGYPEESLLDLLQEEENPYPAPFPEFEYVGQYQGTYLLFQNQEGLYLLDQHAAAERIRYESYREKMGKPSSNTYELIVPMVLEVKNETALFVDPEALDKLKALGVGLEKLDQATFAIREIPDWFPKGRETEYVETMVQKIADGEDIGKEAVRDELAKLLSCKHSLKANKYLNRSEAEELVLHLKKCVNSYTCPHGRPILVKLALTEIEKWFLRVM